MDRLSPMSRFAIGRAMRTLIKSKFIWILCSPPPTKQIMTMAAKLSFRVVWTTAALLCFTIAALATAENVVHSANDLLYDENNKLTSHYLLYSSSSSSDTTKCPLDDFTAPTGFQARPVQGHALQALFGTSAGNNKCPAACIERGVDRSLAFAPMPHKCYDAENDGDFSSWFVEHCRKVEVCVMNYHSRNHPMNLYWRQPETGEWKLHLEIEYGERKTRCFQSFVGHEFVGKDSVSGQEIGNLTVEYTTTVAMGVSPPSGDTASHNFDAEIQSTLHNEWTRHNRVTRTFSELGFKKGRLPDDIFASMGAFYYNNRFNKVREEWNGKGVFVNWWETQCSFIQIPWELKRIWQGRLRELVQAWAGVPVEQTDMYGLRQYEQGARLLTHVDREATHAVSLIVNIAQGNLTEPWPVEVHDHADRLHEVIMEPGDIVYYESAKCLHGRNRPLSGPNAYYVNLFTHYRPVEDSKWFEKPNHEGTPEPLLEVQGECRLRAAGTAETNDHLLGIIETVECDDKRLGPYVSPGLFTATSGADLIDWWRKTGPPLSKPDSGDLHDEL